MGAWASIAEEVRLALLAGTALCLAVLAGVAFGLSDELVIAAAGAIAIGLPAAYLIWHSDPACTLSLGLVLTPFAGNWDALGVPGPLAPDRLLVVAGIAVAVARAPRARGARLPRLASAHWVLLLAVAYVGLSAATAGTLDEGGPFFRFLQGFGVLPFLVFAVAPLAFRTARQRGVLLTSLVGLGAYLGVTAVLETAGLTSLVFPRYITDPDVGVHFGHARGPFVQAAVNGFALFVCAIAAVVASFTWRDRGARLLAWAIATTCILATFLTLQRSVWVGVVLGGLVALAISRDLRRIVAPASVVALVAIGFVLVAKSSVSDELTAVVDQSGAVRARQATYAAALEIVRDRPLTGVGWNRYPQERASYVEQSDDYALIGEDIDQVHNHFLNYAADLGLIGLGLWALALGLAVAGGLRSRGPPDLRWWRLGLLPIVVCFLAIAMFTTPGASFPALTLWAWIGVTWAGCRGGEQQSPGDAGNGAKATRSMTRSVD